MYSLYLNRSCQATFEAFSKLFHTSSKAPFKGNKRLFIYTKYNLQRTRFSIFVENKTLLNLLIQENLISQQNFASFPSEPIKMKYLTSGLLTLFFRISLITE